MKLAKLIVIFVFALVISVSAQENSFPNELPGLEFVGKGKLKTIVFGVTKKQNVERLFGTSCEADCDYDDRFSIKFDYLDLGDCMTTRQIRDRAVCPLDQFIDTIESIKLMPKRAIPVELLSTDVFKFRTGGGSFPKGGGQATYYESFADANGLRYSFRRNDGTTHFPIPKLVGGDLYSIEYILSEELEAKIFKAPFRKAN